MKNPVFGKFKAGVRNIVSNFISTGKSFKKAWVSLPIFKNKELADSLITDIIFRILKEVRNALLLIELNASLKGINISCKYSPVPIAISGISQILKDYPNWFSRLLISVSISIIVKIVEPMLLNIWVLIIFRISAILVKSILLKRKVNILSVVGTIVSLILNYSGYRVASILFKILVPILIVKIKSQF